MQITSTPKPNRDRPQRLQEYQAMLTRRMQEAKGEAHASAFLGVVIGSHHYLISLDEAAEVLPLQVLTPVPLTKPWYLGVLNARGNLLGVVDLAIFMGFPATVTDIRSRVLVLSKDREKACGVVVNALIGLLPIANLQPMETQVESNQIAPWLGERYQSDKGVLWQVLLVNTLINQSDLGQIGR